MKYIRYFFEFLFSIFFFIIFRIIGPKLSSKISGKIFEIIGPFFRSKKVIYNNIKRALPEIDENNLKNIENSMWNNYGRVFAEYIFLKDFRYGRLASNVQIEGQEILPKDGKPYLALANHQSFWENFFMQLIIPKHSWVIKRELETIPIFGWGIKTVQPIAVDRNNNRSIIGGTFNSLSDSLGLRKINATGSAIYLNK